MAYDAKNGVLQRSQLITYHLRLKGDYDVYRFKFFGGSGADSRRRD
jgi:hypothetical protein